MNFIPQCERTMYSASIDLAFQWGLSKHQAKAQADKIWQWHPFPIVCTSFFSYHHAFHIIGDVISTIDRRGVKKVSISSFH